MQNWDWKNGVVFLGLLFVLVLGVSLYFEFYYILFLPVILAFIAISFFKLDWVFYGLFFFTPLSINIEELGVEGIGLFLPTEVMSIALLLLFLARTFQRQSQIENHAIKS